MTSPPSNPPRCVVMLVDDSLLIRKQVSHILTGAGFELLTAVDGVDALEQLETAEISLLISDLNMPRMDGIELLATLAERKVTFPIVVLTTEDQQGVVKKARDLGALAWIVKPCKPSLLVETVARLTSMARPTHPSPEA